MNGYVLELNSITRYAIINYFIEKYKVTETNNCTFKC